MKDNDDKKPCPCTYPGCPRHGDCDACRAYHHAHGEQTSCERQKG
jgi:hypothetical protein